MPQVVEICPLCIGRAQVLPAVLLPRQDGRVDSRRRPEHRLEGYGVRLGSLFGDETGEFHFGRPKGSAKRVVLVADFSVVITAEEHP
jgi:hypothetical protein